jgi:hypothetical protein
VGLSKPKLSSLWTETLLEGAIEMEIFLEAFTVDLFPELQDRPIHFAGESFGGKFVPIYASVSRRRFSSVILVDPYVDPVSHLLGFYDHFCPLNRSDVEGKVDGPSRYFNETVCIAMEDGYQECEILGNACRTSYEGQICKLASDRCMETIGRWLNDEIVAGGRNPYDDRKTCEEPPLCGSLGMLMMIPS